MKIFYKIIILISFFIFIKKEQKLDTSFSIYRSICCLFIFIYALQNFIKSGKKGLFDPFNFSDNDISDLSKWFEAYLIVDFIIMSYIGCKRKDLWLHHGLSLVSICISNYYCKNPPFIINLVLLSEAMSIMSGIDATFTDNNQLIESMYCKKIRKNIINYWRTPLWIITFILGIINMKKKGLSSKVTVGGSICMLLLDRFWLNKCQKVINKY